MHCKNNHSVFASRGVWGFSSFQDRLACIGDKQKIPSKSMISVLLISTSYKNKEWYEKTRGGYSVDKERRFCSQSVFFN
jgi:hypothetical protein